MLITCLGAPLPMEEPKRQMMQKQLIGKEKPPATTYQDIFALRERDWLAAKDCAVLSLDFRNINVNEAF